VSPRNERAVSWIDFDDPISRKPVHDVVLSPRTPYDLPVRLVALGDDGEPEGGVRAITPEIWDQLADGEKTERWVAFAGEKAATWVRLAIRGGRTVATGILIETTEPLEARMLRQVPLARLVDLGARYADDALRMVLPAVQLDRSSIPALPASSRPRSPGRRGVPKDELRRVAQAYIAAGRTHPRQRIAETARLTARSKAQTARLVKRAKHLGLIAEEEQ